MLAQSCQSVAREDQVEDRVVAGNSRGPAKNSPASRVLVVDDEALVRWSVAETLGALDYEIEEAGDGQSAIRAVSPDGAVDIVLLDLRLPDCHDLRVLAAIRHVSPETRIILMTAFGSAELVQEAR